MITHLYLRGLLMDHNSPNQNINTSPATLPTPPLSPSLPPPSPQLQPRPQEESHLEFSRGIRILIWFICNIVFGALPIGAIAIYWQVHSQVSTFPALLIKGDLIAISVAILAEALGHTFLRTLAKPKSLL